MSSSIKKISKLETLILEKRELQTFCSYQEKLIVYKFEELKNNFPEIITSTLLPFTPEKTKVVDSLLDVVNDFILRLLPARFRNNRLTGIVLKLVQLFVVRAFSRKGRSKA